MKWHTAASDHHELNAALDAAAARLSRDLNGQPPDLLLAFVTPHHLFHLGQVGPFLTERLGPRVMIGCSAGGVIGGGVEIEQRPGVTLTAATLPGVDWRLLHLDQDELPPLDGSPKPWREVIGADPDQHPQFLILADPFSLETDKLVQGLDYAYPGCTKIGGLASGAPGPGSTALFADQHILRTGALVLAMWGDIAIDTVVAQGCRPVGAPFRITQCNGQLLQSMDDQTPMDVLQQIYSEMPATGRNEPNVFLGLVMDEMREEVGAGDFLIRNILGMDRNSGAIAVGAELREGQTVQFHVRDGGAAAKDLGTMLRSYREGASGPAPAGALLFSCLGRGRSLFGEADHDTRCFREEVAPIPVGGFFCNGEIGPVGGSTYLHGYTSAFGIVRPRG